MIRAQLQRHPQLVGDRRGELVAALAEPRGDRRDAARRAPRAGLRPALERLAGGLDRAVGVLRRAAGIVPDHLLGRRVDDLDRLGAAGSTHSPPMKILSLT